MLKLKQKSILLYLILGLSLFTGVIALTGTSPANATSHLPPDCWDVVVENNSIDVGFFMDNVTGVYNATEFYGIGDLDAFYNDSATFLSSLNASISNYYNASSGSTYNGTWIHGITLPDGSDVVAVIYTDFGELLAVDVACPSPRHDICNNFEPYIVFDGKLEVVHLQMGDSLRAIYKLIEFDWITYDENPANYVVNATFTNYLPGVNIDGQWLLNIDPALNGMDVVVVFVDMDGFYHAVDGYCEQDRCEDYREFIVVNGFLDIPPIGNDIALADIELLGIFKIDEFDHYMFEMDRLGYLVNNSAINYNTTAILVDGGIKGLNASLEGMHVVIVFKDNSPEGMGDIQARSGFCNDPRMPDFPPIDSITYGVNVGDELIYDIGIPGFGDGSVPFLGTPDSQGGEFMVSNGEQLFVTFVKVPAPQDLTMNNPQLESKLVQEENNPLDILVDLKSGNSSATNEDGFLFALPVEFLQLAVDGFSFFDLGPEPETSSSVPPLAKLSQDDGPEFNPFANFTHDATSVTFEGGDSEFFMKLTYDRDTGVMTRAEFSGTPPVDSTGIAGPSGTLVLELASNLADIGKTDDASSSSTTSDDNGFQSSVPGFEALFLILGFLSLAVIKRRH